MRSMADLGLSEPKSMVLAHIINSNVEYIKYTSDILSQFSNHNNNPPIKKIKKKHDEEGALYIGPPFEMTIFISKTPQMHDN